MVSVLARPRSISYKALLWLFGSLTGAQLLLIVINAIGAPDALNLARDSNIPAFFHSGLLMSIAGACAAIFAASMGRFGTALRYVPHPRLWLAVGVAFAYFSLDEALKIHEWVAHHLFEAMGLWDDMLAGDLTFALWEAVYAPLFGGICLLILVLLFRNRADYPASLWAGLLAIGLWGLALVMEFVTMTFVSENQGVSLGLSRLEEGAEMAGSTLFLLASTLILRGTLGWERRSFAGDSVSPASPSQMLTRPG